MGTAMSNENGTKIAPVPGTLEHLKYCLQEVSEAVEHYSNALAMLDTMEDALAQIIDGLDPISEACGVHEVYPNRFLPYAKTKADEVRKFAISALEQNWGEFDADALGETAAEWLENQREAASG
jgi:hypothetical protein